MCVSTSLTSVWVCLMTGGPPSPPSSPPPPLPPSCQLADSTLSDSAVGEELSDHDDTLTDQVALDSQNSERHTCILLLLLAAECSGVPVPFLAAEPCGVPILEPIPSLPPASSPSPCQLPSRPAPTSLPAALSTSCLRNSRQVVYVYTYMYI